MKPKHTETAPTACKQEGAKQPAQNSTLGPKGEVANSLVNQGFAVLAVWQPLSVGPRAECACDKLQACRHVGKHPKFDKDTLRNGAHSATTNADVVRSWWLKWPEANIGIATGRRHGVLVIDVDPRHGGDGTLMDLAARLGPLPPTIECLTGGGGRHLFFRHPSNRVKATLGSGVDVQSDGKFVAAHGSMHRSGNKYCWEESSAPSCMEMSTLPEAWARELFSSEWVGDEGEDKGNRDDRDVSDVSKVHQQPSSVVPVVPIVPITQSGAMPDWTEDRVIGMTVPRGPGQHDRKTNDFARGVKFNLGIGDSARAHPLFQRWWALARPHCQEKDEDAAWGKFCRVHRLARFPLGSESPFAACVEEALKHPFPPFPDPQPGIKVKQLAGACREMSRRVGGSFKLSCYQVKQAFGVPVKTAWEWLRRLEVACILRCLDRGRPGPGGKGAAKFEYIGPDRASGGGA